MNSLSSYMAADLLCGKANSGTTNIVECLYTGPTAYYASSANIGTASATQVKADQLKGGAAAVDSVAFVNWTKRANDIIIPSAVVSFAPATSKPAETTAEAITTAPVTTAPAVTTKEPLTTKEPISTGAPVATNTPVTTPAPVTTASAGGNGGCRSAVVGILPLIAAAGMGVAFRKKKDN